MKSWIFRNLPSGTELPHHRGVAPGSKIHVLGWRHPGSVDVRTVVRLVTARCDDGVMALLDAPLHNQPAAGAWVSLAWTREGGKAA